MSLLALASNDLGSAGFVELAPALYPTYPSSAKYLME
jgi:hypothetical protein